MKFSEMDLSSTIVKALKDHEIISPTEIQQKSIQIMLKNTQNHLIGQAKTGSGKTFAFAIPMMEKLRLKNKHVQSLVIVPTRELCKQVARVFRQLSQYKPAKIVEVYGGVSIKRQINQLRNGGQVVIATPGRLIDLYRRRQISFKYVKYVALDEADRMLDMGFLPDIEIILLKAMQKVNPQLMLFSATLLDDIKHLIHRFKKDKHIIEINLSQDELTVGQCDQIAYYVPQNNKYGHFLKILKQYDPEYALIFTKTKRKSREICKRLKKEVNLQIRVGYLNGDLSQSKRESIMHQFRTKKINCLVGTNVLARGLDFPKVSHVFNYDLPRDPEVYVHRIGRTARVSGISKDINPGTAISVVAPYDKQNFRKIKRLIQMKIKTESLGNKSGTKTKNRQKNRKKTGSSKSNNHTQKNRSKQNHRPNQHRRSKQKSRSTHKHRSKMHRIST